MEYKMKYAIPTYKQWQQSVKKWKKELAYSSETGKPFHPEGLCGFCKAVLDPRGNPDCDRCQLFRSGACNSSNKYDCDYWNYRFYSVNGNKAPYAMSILLSILAAEHEEEI